MVSATPPADAVIQLLAEQRRAVELFQGEQGLRIDAYVGYRTRLLCGCGEHLEARLIPGLQSRHSGRSRGPLPTRVLFDTSLDNLSKSG